MCMGRRKRLEINIYIYIYIKAKISLSTKVCLVKAMVFPIVMYGCESWTIKKTKHQMLSNCDAGEDS